MTPKAFIVVDSGSVTESIVTGDTKVEVVVLDFDSIEIDAEEARQILVDHGDDLANINGPAGARDLKTRLQDIVDEADAEDFEEEDYDEEEEEDEDEDDFDDEDEDQEDDDKKEEDYNGDEFNVPAPAFPAAGTFEEAEFGPEDKSV